MRVFIICIIKNENKSLMYIVSCRVSYFYLRERRRVLPPLVLGILALTSVILSPQVVSVLPVRWYCDISLLVIPALDLADSIYEIPPVNTINDNLARSLALTFGFCTFADMLRNKRMSWRFTGGRVGVGWNGLVRCLPLRLSTTLGWVFLGILFWRVFITYHHI